MGLAPDFKFTKQETEEATTEEKPKPKVPPRGAPVFKGWEKQYLPDEDEEEEATASVPEEDENPSW